MKFYRVEKTCESGQSAGFEYYTTQREANKAARQWCRNNPHEIADVKEITIETNKRGILRALTTWAAHPDNG